ncbi:uncharacterized protein [Salminus brasiliensis]|uniref:uncharacterized protein n=1 Tax=Salminus brasiliensis TaxID=930266 RepID=UPI003B834402
MRTLSALLMVLLLGSLQLTSSAPAVHHADCCPKLTAVKKIPLRQVVSYTRTSSYCTVKAIVINTKAGNQFCVDLDAEWVKGYVAILDQRHNTTPTTASPHTALHSTPEDPSLSAPMRTLSALLVALLLSSLQLTSSAPAPAVIIPDCCFKLTAMKIPLKKVKSYTKTSSDCYLKAVIFHTVHKKQICVDPTADWVQKHMKAMDQGINKRGKCPPKPKA